MKPFDFNVHPNFNLVGSAKSNPFDSVISELTCTPSQIIQSFDVQLRASSWRDYISGFNCMVFTSHFHNFAEDASEFTMQMIQLCNAHDLSVDFTFLANPHLIHSFEHILSCWVNAGVKFIKFHSYHQQITDELIVDCVQIAKMAEASGVGVCIDASYGSLGMYRYDNLKLAAEILLKVKDVPVVILHAGGLRALEATLIAASCENAFIELSFSPHYYLNTSHYRTFIDMFKLLPPSRFLYASDFPYVNHRESLLSAERLLLDSLLSKSESEDVLRRNSLRLLHRSD